MDYLGKHFDDCLNQATHLLLHNPEVNAVAHVAEAFMRTGTQNWRWKTVEWLMVYMLTEAAVTPHNIRQGRASVSLLMAYDGLAPILVR